MLYFALSADGRTFVLGDGGVLGGIAKAYTLSADNVWQQMGASFKGKSTPTHSDATGSAVGISNEGKTIAIGSALYDNGCGKVEVYDFGTKWELRGRSIECWENTEKVGASLFLSGDGNNVLIFDRLYHWVTSSASWEQLGTDTSGRPYLDTDMAALSNDGTVVAMASIYSDASSGGLEVNAYSFNEASAQWEQLGNTITQLMPGAKYTNLALNAHGNTFLVSWAGGIPTGLIRVFGLASNTWKQIGQSLPDEGIYAKNGGASVGMNYDGNKILVTWMSGNGSQQTQFFQVYVKSS